MKKYISVLLIYLFLFSNMEIIYSKYNHSIKMKNNIAIAKWDIKTDIHEDKLELVSGNNIQDYIINITYNSEIAFNYEIILSNIPPGLIVALNDTSYISPNSDNQIIFKSEKISTAYSSTTIKDILHFKTALDTDNFYYYKLNIEIKFYQVNI